MSRAPPSSTVSSSYASNNGLIDFQDTQYGMQQQAPGFPGGMYQSSACQVPNLMYQSNAYQAPSGMYQPYPTVSQPIMPGSGPYQPVQHPNMYERGVYPSQPVAQPAPAMYQPGFYPPVSQAVSGGYLPVSQAVSGGYPPGYYQPISQAGGYQPVSRAASEGYPYPPVSTHSPCYAGPPSFLHVNGVDYEPVAVSNNLVATPKSKISDSVVERHVADKVDEFMSKKASSSKVATSSYMGKSASDSYAKDLKKLNDDMRKSLAKVRGK